MKNAFIYLLPSLIPIILYVISYYWAYNKTNKSKQAKFFSKHLASAFMYTMVLAVLGFIIFIAFYLYNTKTGVYVPSYMENGKLHRGYIE